ncbi:hypothetical protein GGP93_003234 [Salinibacter ruber]|jgi:hypothetical protein|nr:hypothetical protein [Salinibacter ruber]
MPVIRRFRSLRSSRPSRLQSRTSSAETEPKGESREEVPTRENTNGSKFQRGQIQHPRQWYHRARVVVWDSNSGSHGGSLPEVSLSQVRGEEKYHREGGEVRFFFRLC